MKRHWWKKLAILILVMGTGAPLYAQYWYEQPQPKWRLYGDAGFDFNQNTLGTHGNAGDGECLRRHICSAGELDYVSPHHYRPFARWLPSGGFA